MTIQLPFSVLYEVYETNEKLEKVRVIHQGYHRDIAETVMFRCFEKSNRSKDYLLLDRNQQIHVSMCLSPNTVSNRELRLR